MRVAVIDTETTGIPGRTPTHLLRLTEVGAVIVDTEDPTWVGPTFAATIRTARWVLDAPEVAGAMALSDLGDELRAGGGEDRAAVEERFLAWLDAERPERWTAFNLEFDAKFLTWIQLPVPGDCLMLWSQAVIDRLTPGWLPQLRDGRSKWPRSTESAAWCRERGHVISDGREHRALTDALREADIMRALIVEDR